MELKVWVEGIQRVVCGVSEATTCQDVVVALAHATGKTGRFTLIEKWRDTERLLAPSDYPLKTLHKWGEYSSEVVFVLRHSDRHRKERSSKRTDKFSHNFSPHSPADAPSSTPGKGLKKSLTFSGAHSYPKNHLTALRRHPIQDNSSLESIDDQSSVTSQSSMSTMSPYGSLEKRHHRHRGHNMGMPHHNNNNKPLYSSLEKHKTKAHRLKSPSPYSSSSHYSQQSPRSDNTPNGSLERQRNNSPPHSPHELTPKIEQLEEYDLDRHLVGNRTDNGTVTKSRPTGSIDFTKLNGNVGKDTEFRETSPTKGKSAPAEKDDLAKLIKLQQEKLSIQASQIKVLDTEINYWETREKDCDRQAAQTAAELDRVQKRDAEVDNELQELDIVSWADKLEIEKQNQKTLQSEITLMRSRLSNCETELLQNKNKSLLLSEDVEKEKKELLKQEQEQKEQEIRILQDISEVQKQLNQKLVQYEKNQDDIEGLQNEVKKLESSILERKTQLADCEKELREVNMEIFMKVPNSLEGSSSALNRLSPSRPGSARRMMYSPILLKEAVATTTNPHGLWV